MDLEFATAGSVLENLEVISRSFSIPVSSKPEKTYKSIHDTGRIFSTRTFLVEDDSLPRGTLPDLNAFLPSEQEKSLAKDLLYLLSGAESCLISVHHISKNKIGFSVSVFAT